jgi:hypothetical protein
LLTKMRELPNQVSNGKTPIDDGIEGLRMVKMLEAVDKSLKKKREVVYL